jgi:CRISPR/Cas system-associated exonuclease Cas4 (RecB family)|tara:strand:+ start:1428 stop:2219 length:792 start_codon:yes stop_codon:yes gene_type:complete
MEHMVHPEIKLSHSSSTSFCSKQLWYKKVGGDPFTYNFYSGAGTIVDSGYEAGLKNIMTGIEGSNIRNDMEQKLGEMEESMDYTEYVKLANSLDIHVRAVEDYMGWINYKPLETQYFFNIIFDGHTRRTTGYMDIVAERQGLPLIIDVKRQSKPAKKAKREWIMQGALYALVIMKKRNLTEIPAFENHLIIPDQPPVFLKTDLTSEDLFMAYKLLTELNSRIDNDYWPLNRSHALCSPMWCNVYDKCHYENFVGVDELVGRIQ